MGLEPPPGRVCLATKMAAPKLMRCNRVLKRCKLAVDRVRSNDIMESCRIQKDTAARAPKTENTPAWAPTTQEKSDPKLSSDRRHLETVLRRNNPHESAQAHFHLVLTPGWLVDSFSSLALLK